MNHDRYLVIGTDDETAQALTILLGKVPTDFRSAVMSKKDVSFRTINRVEIEELDKDELEMLEQHAKDRFLETLTALY